MKLLLAAGSRSDSGFWHRYSYHRDEASTAIEICRWASSMLLQCRSQYSWMVIGLVDWQLDADWWCSCSFHVSCVVLCSCMYERVISLVVDGVPMSLYGISLIPPLITVIPTRVISPKGVYPHRCWFLEGGWQRWQWLLFTKFIAVRPSSTLSTRRSGGWTAQLGVHHSSC